jgi:hypothetical protein
MIEYIIFKVERPDGSTFEQLFYLDDIPVKFLLGDSDGRLYLNLKAITNHYFGSGYRISGFRFEGEV